MKRHEYVVHGLILACLLLSGIRTGFNVAIVLGILGLVGIYHRADFLPAKPDTNLAQKWPHEQEFEDLKNKVSKLAATIAFRVKSPGAGAEG